MTTAAPAKQGQKAVYQLQGTLLEVCSCGVLCPCWVGEDPDGGECFSFLSHSFHQGQIDGIDVSGLSIVSVVHIPGNVLTPKSWRMALFVVRQGIGRAEGRDRPRIHRPARGAARGPRGVGRRGRLDRERQDRAQRRRRQGDSENPGHPGGRDGAVPERRRHDHDTAGQHLQHRARITGVGGEGVASEGRPAEARVRVGPRRRPQRDPVRLQDGALFLMGGGALPAPLRPSAEPT